LNDPSAVPEVLSSCSAVAQNGKCKCSFAVTHFSTFAVGEAPQPPIDPAKSSPETPSETPNIGAIAGGVVGAIALVVIVAFVIIKMRKRASVQAEEKTDEVKEDTKP
jgi:hypothetical protein